MLVRLEHIVNGRTADLDAQHTVEFPVVGEVKHVHIASENLRCKVVRTQNNDVIATYLEVVQATRLSSGHDVFSLRI